MIDIRSSIHSFVHFYNTATSIIDIRLMPRRHELVMI